MINIRKLISLLFANNLSITDEALVYLTIIGWIIWLIIAFNKEVVDIC